MEEGLNRWYFEEDKQVVKTFFSQCNLDFRMENLGVIMNSFWYKVSRATTWHPNKRFCLCECLHVCMVSVVNCTKIYSNGSNLITNKLTNIIPILNRYKKPAYSKTYVFNGKKKHICNKSNGFCCCQCLFFLMPLLLLLFHPIRL